MRQVKVWTSPALSKHLDSLIFSHYIVELLMCLGSLPCSMTRSQPSFSCSTDGLTCFSCIQESHKLVKLTDCKAIFSCGYQINPNDNPSTTVLDSWDEAFVLICCVGKRERRRFPFFFGISQRDLGLNLLGRLE